MLISIPVSYLFDSVCRSGLLIIRSFQDMLLVQRRTVLLTSAAVQTTPQHRARTPPYSLLRGTVRICGELETTELVERQMLTRYFSDAPFSLMLAAMQAIPVLTGTQGTGFDFTIYTGDLISHDPDNQLARYA